MLSPDVLEMISQNPAVAFDPKVIMLMREVIGEGDPWPVVEEVHRTNPDIGKMKMYEAIGLQVEYLNDRGPEDLSPWDNPADIKTMLSADPPPLQCSKQTFPHGVDTGAQGGNCGWQIPF